MAWSVCQRSRLAFHTIPTGYSSHNGLKSLANFCKYELCSKSIETGAVFTKPKISND